jgi:hypothetical protein
LEADALADAALADAAALEDAALADAAALALELEAAALLLELALPELQPARMPQARTAAARMLRVFFMMNHCLSLVFVRCRTRRERARAQLRAARPLI